MNRIRTSLDIITRSFGVLRREPKLVLFPIFNMSGVLFMVAFFAVPAFFETTVFTAGDEFATFREMMDERSDAKIAEEEAGGPLLNDSADVEPVTIGRVTFVGDEVNFPLLPLGMFYLMVMILMTYVNVAFYSEIMQAYNGNRVLLMRGMAFATSKWRAILVWSLLAGIIGLVIRKIEENVGFMGRWITGLIGFSWSVASVFAIPVIVRDQQQTNPVVYLKTSAGIIKRTWGEGLVGVVGISSIFIILMVAFTAVAVVMMITLPFAALYTAIGMFSLIFILGYLSTLMKDIFLCGLYVYATEGVVPGGFDEALMEDAWRVKKKKS